jgi:hypothetical protein
MNTHMHTCTHFLSLSLSLALALSFSLSFSLSLTHTGYDSAGGRDGDVSGEESKKRLGRLLQTLHAAVQGSCMENIYTLNDIPDEFLDPLTCALMIDPVTLPSSRQIVDRSTIMRHLHLNKNNKPDDPFSRTPLTADMLEPNHDLRLRISQWLDSRRKKQ